MNIVDFLATLTSVFSLASIVTLGSAVAVLTKVLTAMPIEWTTKKGMVLAWLVSAVGVTFIGLIEGASAGVIIPIAIGTALVSHGLYDVIKKLYSYVK